MKASVVWMGLLLLAACEGTQLIESNPAGAKLTLVSGMDAPAHLRRIDLGETPIDRVRVPKQFKNYWEFDAFIKERKGQVFVEAQAPGFVVTTIPLERVYSSALRSSDAKKIMITMKPVIGLKRFLKMTTRQDVRTALLKTVTINSNVTNALIFINGQPAGNTPFTTQHPPGTFFVELKHTGCAESANELVSIKNSAEASHLNIFFKSCKRKEVATR